MGVVTIGPEPAGSTDAQRCLQSYFAELAERFPEGFDPHSTVSADVAEVSPPNGEFFVVRSDGEAKGCGALKTFAPGIGEIKRMWVHQDLRGTGSGRRLLAALEQAALDRGLTTVRLDTSAHLTEAIGLYRSAGYAEIEDYNNNPYAALWFEKQLREPLRAT